MRRVISRQRKTRARRRAGGHGHYAQGQGTSLHGHFTRKPTSDEVVLQHGHSAPAHSGGYECGHPPLQRPSRLLSAALWPREESPRRVGARESPRWRSGACLKPPIPPPLTLYVPAVDPYPYPYP